MKKIIVRDGACIGCGACIAIDPNHFDFNDDGYAMVISNEDLETSALKNAISSCPTNAIKMIDDNEHHCSCEDDAACGENCSDCTCK